MQNILDPAILFFIFGVFAGAVKSNLEIPPAITKFLSLYLLMILSASASYIAVPAALKYALPQANPSLYFGMSLGLTFPINIIIGIPLYTYIAKLFF